MITRLELTNFMSHRHTVIEPAPGLTVLVGPNNCGKSAVVAALQILCRNETSTYVLRHGERECSVKLDTDDGHTIEWRRKNSPSYRVNGQVFDRLGRNGVPDELHPVLRLPLVDGGGDADFDVHFGSQKTPIFLLGSSAANAARFFASSSDAIRLVAMQKRHKEKLADAQKEKNRLEAQSKKLAGELESLEPVAELDERLALAEQLFREIALCQATLEEAHKLQVDWSGQLRVLERHAAVSASLAGLSAPPEMAPVELLGATIASIDSEEHKRDRATDCLRALAPLAAPPRLEDERSLERMASHLAEQRIKVDRHAEECRGLASLAAPPILGDMAALDRLVVGLTIAERQERRSSHFNETLSRVSSLPQLGDEAPLRQLVAALAAAAADIERGERACRTLAAAAVAPAPLETGPLAEMIQRLAAATLQEKRCGKSMAETEIALAAAAAKLREAAEGAVCPTCGSQLDADRIVARAAAGAAVGGHDHD